MGEQASTIQEGDVVGAGGRRSRVPVIVAVAVLAAVVVGLGVVRVAAGPSSDEALFYEEQLDRAEEILRQGIPDPVDRSSLVGPRGCDRDTFFHWTRSDRGIRIDAVYFYRGAGTMESAREWIDAQLQEALLPAGIVRLDPDRAEWFGYSC
jgi:hypothetical protein